MHSVALLEPRHILGIISLLYPNNSKTLTTKKRAIRNERYLFYLRENPFYLRNDSVKRSPLHVLRCKFPSFIMHKGTDLFPVPFFFLCSFFFSSFFFFIESRVRGTVYVSLSVNVALFKTSRLETIGLTHFHNRCSACNDFIYSKRHFLFSGKVTRRPPDN